jgi:hypothetical protein
VLGIYMILRKDQIAVFSGISLRRSGSSSSFLMFFDFPMVIGLASPSSLRVGSPSWWVVSSAGSVKGCSETVQDWLCRDWQGLRQSPMAGGMGLYMLTADGEQGLNAMPQPSRGTRPRFPSDAVRMADASPALSRGYRSPVIGVFNSPPLQWFVLPANLFRGPRP